MKPLTPEEVAKRGIDHSDASRVLALLEERDALKASEQEACAALASRDAAVRKAALEDAANSFETSPVKHWAINEIALELRALAEAKKAAP